MKPGKEAKALALEPSVLEDRSLSLVTTKEYRAMLKDRMQSSARHYESTSADMAMVWNLRGARARTEQEDITDIMAKTETEIKSTVEDPGREGTTEADAKGPDRGLPVATKDLGRGEALIKSLDKAARIAIAVARLVGGKTTEMNDIGEMIMTDEDNAAIQLMHSNGNYAGLHDIKRTGRDHNFP